MEAETLAALALIGAAGFLVITREMMRLSNIIQSRGVEIAGAGFLLLALAQILSATSYLIGGERIAYMTYVGSASSSLIAYLLLISSTSKESNEGDNSMALAPVTMLPASLDLASLVASALLAWRAQGAARAGFLLLSISHMLRSLPLVLGGVPALYLLLGGEVIRVAASVSLAVFYAGGLLRVAKEK